MYKSNPLAAFKVALTYTVCVFKSTKFPFAARRLAERRKSCEKWVHILDKSDAIARGTTFPQNDFESSCTSDSEKLNGGEFECESAPRRFEFSARYSRLWNATFLLNGI